jgi:hypothetical protein
MVITADEQMRGGKALALKAIVDEALTGPNMAVRDVIVYRRTGGKVDFTAPRDKWLHELVAKEPATCEPEWVLAEHPLFLLYTSGSTGKPKGVQHSTGGYLLHAALTTKWTFDLKPDDVFWCTADIGWVTGHTYITYGPLALGGTEVVSIPDPAPASGRRSPSTRSDLHPRRWRSGAHQDRRGSRSSGFTILRITVRRRADQSGGLLVPQGSRRGLPGRRHLADRDRRP